MTTRLTATLTPDTLAASGLPPMAKMFLPKRVLFHSTQTKTLAMAA